MTKQDDIKSLLKIAYLGETHLQKVVPGFIAALGEIDPVKKESLLKSVIEFSSSEEFIDEMAKNFDAVFTEDEISDLLRFYESAAMKKCIEHGDFLVAPLYSSISSFIKEEMKKTA